MDAQRAQIGQSTFEDGCTYFVYQYIMIFIKDSQRAQIIINKGLNEGVNEGVNLKIEGVNEGV